ncbi:immune inhibitor A domain-containing protein [Streptomyces smaragdinus]|uniref:immune inhibitor A domain-containing protein n=1 Tax=Streptomyces smaragdinus TaxID=2585196 RepID=UPI001E43E37C|nr:immune inhibitor A domain-containing protein [Streptomyces smaragdinus]
MSGAIPSSTPWRLTAALAVTALLAGGLTAASGAASGADVTRYAPSASDAYINYVDPRNDQYKTEREVKVGTAPDGSPIYSTRPSPLGAHLDKYAGGNPRPGRVLAQQEKEFGRSGRTPFEQRFKNSRETQEAKLLTILVEFDENANDDFTGTMVPRATFDDDLTPDQNERDCVPAEDNPDFPVIQNGPVHNNIPNPAEASHKDNNSLWIDDFSPDFYNDILYTKRGYTKRVRPDLKGPDGRRGIDISGNTMRNMYSEMSKGRYTVTGEATPWITVPHSEAWYGANTCTEVEPGVWQAGVESSMNGHPDNPSGPGQLAVDAVRALAAAQPDFPWEEYDVENPSAPDGGFGEPDGIVDHLVLVHAGEDKSGGGGAQGPYSIWAHSSAVVPGFTVPGTDLAVSNYIVQPEDSGVGVFAHEYGHDLGLPDVYDTASGGDSDVDFWDLMASGSHAGPIFQSQPAHMGIWEKFVMGWAEPKVFDVGDRPEQVKLGQSSRTPKGTEDGALVRLPDKVVNLVTPHGGSNVWWSGNDQSWADVRLTRPIDVPAGSDVRFWSWDNYSIEADWDYGFVEVSTDGGATFEELKVYDEGGDLVSTDDGYADPNGRMNDFGGKKYGLTGDTGGQWRHDYVDLTPYAGQTVQLRLRSATDAAFEAGGWFADDFSVTSGGDTVWSDGAESGDGGWTAATGSFTDTTGSGWGITDGVQHAENYYLAEWRNLDGFDRGLAYAYDTTYQRDGAWKVERAPYNAPGMLVWYRDFTYGEGLNFTNHTLNNLGGLPSHGTKGGLLLADSHFDPLRRTGAAADKDPTALKNLPSRPNSANAAFTRGRTPAFTECLEAPGEPFSEYCTRFASLRAVPGFTDAKGWYPGIEVRGTADAPEFYYKDSDASVVVPSDGNRPYSVRVTDAAGRPLPDWYGTDLGLGQPLGSGDPAGDGAALGVKLELGTTAPFTNQWAMVRVTPASPTP